MPELSPPWYTLENMLSHALNNHSTVTVQPLDTKVRPYVASITVTDKQQALALATILAPQHRFGNVIVDVCVKDSHGSVVPIQIPESPESLVQMMKTALGNTPWFSDAMARPFVPGSRMVVFPIFKAAVIQFFNDDLSDLFRNYNNIAEAVFHNILNPSPGGIQVSPSTVKLT